MDTNINDRTVTYARVHEIIHRNLAIPTGVVHLDKIFGGGIQLGTVTEVFGEVGCGKTQFCLELCFNCLIPKPLGRLDVSQVIFVTTSNSFCKQRVLFFAQRYEDWFKNFKSTIDYKNIRNFHEFTVDDALRRIIFKRVYDHQEMMHAMHSIYRLVFEAARREEPVRLVIVDGFSDHLRVLPVWERLRYANDYFDVLENVASYFNVAVVITCDTTIIPKRMRGFIGDGIDDLQTALGQTFSHRPQQRIRLKRTSPNSEIIDAIVLKTVMGKCETAQLVIDDKNGLLDAEVAAKVKRGKTK